MRASTLKPLRIVAAPNRGVRADSRATVEIYRPFFLAGIVSVLTAGCLLGAVALWGIAMNASYTASAWTPYVLAHANSQLYGWVGFFVMGFALQQHAPRVSRLELFYSLAYASLLLMAVGIGTRFAAEPLAATNPAVWLPIGTASCVVQAVAVLMFIANIGLTRARTGEGLSWQTMLVFASLFWWCVVAIAEPFFFIATHSGSANDRVLFIARWFPPYREAQFLGFVAMMIFGVALVRMHTCFGARKACPYLGLTGFALWNLGLVGRAVGWSAKFQGEFAPGTDTLYRIGTLLMLVGALCLVASSRMFGRLESSLASHKFIRAAFVWLIVAAFMAAVEPLHLFATGAAFSHAYTGAIRHALTVGFISQMIVGVSLHVVARMNDLPPSAERPLSSVFWLLNIGNAARVGLEVATDYSHAAFAPMGFTGFVELAALAVWATHVARLMLWRRRLSHA